MSDSHEIVVVEPRPLARRLHPMVEMVQGAGHVDPATMRDLLELQRAYEADEARRAYHDAMADARRDLPSVIAHDSRVAFGETRYTYTSLAAIVEAVSEPLAAHGLILTWDVATPAERVVQVTARLTHRAGHSVAATLSCPPDAQGRKTPAQGIESSITTLRRATALAILGLATAEDRAAPATADPDVVDETANRRAAAALRAAGIDVEEVERRVGRSAPEWTAADRAVAREVYDERRARSTTVA